MSADLSEEASPSQDRAGGGQEGRRTPSLMSFVADKPKIALSILVGAVALCGLWNAIFFFNNFNIPYRLYLGATDFVTVAVRSSPSVVGALGVAILLALALALVVWLVVEVSLWLLPKLLFAYRRSLPRPCAEAEMRLGNGAVARILRLTDRPCAASADRATRIEKAVRAMRRHPRYMRRLRAHFSAKRARAFRCAFRTHLKNALALATCLDFADRNYRELFVAATLAVALIGAFTSHVAANRIQVRLKALPGMTDVGTHSPCQVLDAANGTGDSSMGGAIRGLAMAMFDYLYVDTYLQCASVNLAGVPDSVDNLVLLGSTTSHTFFYSVGKKSPFVVQTDAIETLSQSRILPRTPERASATNEDLMTGHLLARLDTMTDELRTLVSSAQRPEPIIVFAPGSVRAGRQERQCTEVPGAEFRFARGLARFHREHLEDNRNALRAVVRYFATEGADVRPGDYVLVVGHADVSGDVNFNEWLSERRAEHILEVLSKAELGHVFDAAYAIGVGEGARAFDIHPDRETAASSCTTAGRRRLVWPGRR